MYIIILSNKFTFFHWFVDVPAGICISNVTYIIGRYMWNMCMHNESELPHTPHLALETSQPKYSLEQMQWVFWNSCPFAINLLSLSLSIFPLQYTVYTCSSSPHPYVQVWFRYFLWVFCQKFLVRTSIVQNNNVFT